MRKTHGPVHIKQDHAKDGSSKIIFAHQQKKVVADIQISLGTAATQIEFHSIKSDWETSSWKHTFRNPQQVSI